MDYFSCPEGLGMNEAYEALLLNVAFPEAAPRTVIGIIGGGGTRGSATAGSAAGFQKLGLHRGIRRLVLASTGIIPGLYMAANQAHVAAAAYLEICGHRSFIRFHRRGVVAVDKVMRAIRGKSHMGRYKLDIEAARASQTKAWILVATPDGEVKCLPWDYSLDLIHAGIALPGWLYGKSVLIDGQQYQDAAVLEPLATEQAKKLVKQEGLKPEKVLFLWFPNQALPLPRALTVPLTRKQKFQLLPTLTIELLLQTAALWGCSSRFRTLAKQARKRLQRRFEDAIYDSDGIEFAVVPTPEGLPMSPFCTDRNQLQYAISAAYYEVLEGFEAFRQDLWRLGPLQGREYDQVEALRRFYAAWRSMPS